MDNPMPVGYIPPFPFSTKNLVSSLQCKADTVYSYEKYSAYNRKNFIKEKSVLIFQLDLTTVERKNLEELKRGKVRKDRINSIPYGKMFIDRKILFGNESLPRSLS